MSLLRIVSKTVLKSGSSLVILNPPKANIARWVRPTLMEIRARKRKIEWKTGRPMEQNPRSEFIEWNYEKEIFAFGMRLKERFNHQLLMQAFVDRSYIVQEEMKQRAVGVEEPALNIQDNSSLAKKGEELMTEFIISYLNISLPKFPRDGIKAIYKHLTSNEVLAHISMNLGTKDIILSSEYPPSEQNYINTLKAIIGALFESSGEARAYEFIRDFICTQLNQVDVNEFWKIDDPEALLNEICKDKKMGVPEPRLIGELGKNTLMAAYYVGMYSDKKCIGSGFGESVEIAKEEAIKDSLRNFFQTNLNIKPFDFNMPVQRVMQSLNKPSIAAIDN